MRDLRSNVRIFTEPITIIIYEEEVIDGVVENLEPKEHKTYANVMAERKRESNSTTSSEIIANSIIVQARRNTGYILTPDQTIIKVRGKEYIVKNSDEFGLNQEYINIHCVLRND